MEKKKFPKFLLPAIVLVVALLYFLPSKTFDELLPLPDEVSVTATYWHADNSYTVKEWEAGSPQAEDVLNDLRSTTYSKNPIHTLSYRLRRIGSALDLDTNSGILTLELRDNNGAKYLIGFMNTEITFTSPGSSLSKGWMSADPELKGNLVERVIIAPEN